jgi:hypothetical protein
MDLWTLQTDTDFTQFWFPLLEDKNFFHALEKEYYEEAKSILGVWRPLYMVRDEPMKYPDFFEIDNTDIIAISQRAADSLSSLFNNQIELLPIETDAGRYYALNNLNFIDCLNKKESKYIATNNGIIVSYSLLEFDELKFGNNAIFKIPELPYTIFISGDFVELYEDNNLQGLLLDTDLNLIWYPE